MCCRMWKRGSILKSSKSWSFSGLVLGVWLSQVFLGLVDGYSSPPSTPPVLPAEVFTIYFVHILSPVDYGGFFPLVGDTGRLD